MEKLKNIKSKLKFISVMVDKTKLSKETNIDIVNLERFVKNKEHKKDYDIDFYNKRSN